MELIFKIAWRNILRHRGKSIIIGIILFLGSLIMTVGNGVISGMDSGLEKNIVNGFMGDIVIISSKERSDNILFKIMGKSVETITNYKDIKPLLEQQDYIEAKLPVGKNGAMVINEEEGEPGYAYLLGVDFKEYKEFFKDNITPVEGTLLGDAEQGFLMSAKARDELYESMNVWFIPHGGKLEEANLSEDAKENLNSLIVKENPVFMGFSDNNSSSDIRVPVKGIIKYRALNTIWGHFAIMDIESYRRALGYFSSADTKIDISDEKKMLLESDDLDSMFGSESIIVPDKGSKDIDVDFTRKKLSTTEGVDLESGTYNLIFIKLKSGISMEHGVSRLNEAFSNAALSGTDPGVRAVTWKKGAGPIGNMATIIKGALFFFVMMLFVVAIIIIVNTLTMATLERVTEIGMMRAVGARKSFISGMFVGETAMLSGLFGGFGIIVGVVVVKLIPYFNITTDNDMVQLLYGGDKFFPILSFVDIFVVIMQLFAVTVITVLYPVKVATGIVPLDAISRD
ncbi:MAG: FtsX-like permease family protein [Desulfamplus sp.]|nr:FtsX-like permease family protein [Desulfamplus sp.]